MFPTFCIEKAKATQVEKEFLGDAGDRTEMMNDIRQLGQVTATLSSLRIVEDPVVKICERIPG
jgi:hypothetical protein